MAYETRRTTISSFKTDGCTLKTDEALLAIALMEELQERGYMVSFDYAPDDVKCSYAGSALKPDKDFIYWSARATAGGDTLLGMTRLLVKRCNDYESEIND